MLCSLRTPLNVAHVRATYIYNISVRGGEKTQKSLRLDSGEAMEDDGGEKSSFVIGLIENRAKEVQVLLLAISFTS